MTRVLMQTTNEEMNQCREEDAFYSTTKKEEIFDEIVPGDMVWCLMPLSKAELAKVPEGHKVRPYLIVKKDNHILYGHPASSKKHNGNIYENFKVTKDFYTSRKDSYINLNKLYAIPKENIRKMFHHLNQVDLERLYHIFHSGNKKKYRYIEFYKGHNTLYKGDVILYNNEYYYAYKSNVVCTYALHITKTNKCGDIIIQGQHYTLDKQKCMRFKTRMEEDVVVAIADSEEQERIDVMLFGTNKVKEEQPKRKQTKGSINLNVYCDVSLETVSIPGAVYVNRKQHVVFLYKDNKNYYGIPLLYNPLQVQLVRMDEKQFYYKNICDQSIFEKMIGRVTSSVHIKKKKQEAILNYYYG